MSYKVEVENFTEEEVKDLSPELVVKLQVIRYMAGVPIYVTSGFRPEDSASEHSEREGVDISDNDEGEPIESDWRHKILKAVYAIGFRRVGLYDRHIHLGISINHPLDVSWRGESS